MPDELNESALQKIDDLCNELLAGGAHDPEHREEIRGHLEDKLLGYLSGQERISEEDALLLVQAHFGDGRGIGKRLSRRQIGPPAVWARHRRIVRLAGATAALAFIGVPICRVLAPSGPSVIALIGCLAVLESGVLLAARADLRSLWQRIVSAVLMLPILAVVCAVLVSGLQAVVAHPAMPVRVIDVAIAAMAIGCLVNHAFLLLLLLAPMRRRIEFSVR